MTTQTTLIEQQKEMETLRTDLQPDHGKDFVDFDQMLYDMSMSGQKIEKGKDLIVLENHRDAYGQGPWQLIQLSEKGRKAFEYFNFI